MGRRWLMVVTAVAVPALWVALLPGEGTAAVRVAVAGRTGSASPVSSWSRAEVVPGQAINTGGQDQIVSLSCGAPGDCAGAGFYTTPDQHRHALLVTETKGTWQAQEVRGLWPLNHVDYSGLSQVSCASAGNCTAVGAYQDPAGRTQALVVSERNGNWDRAEKIPTARQGGWISSVSCWAAGDCTAAGAWYTSTGTRAFVVGSRNGRWGTAELVPGTAALNQGGNAAVTMVSCPAAGQCSATGIYGDDSEVFVDSERDYAWGGAEQMPGTSRDGFIAAYAFSCGSPGNCTAGGYYETSVPSPAQAYVEDQVNGTWRPVLVVPGTYGRERWAGGEVLALSCPAAGSCIAGGDYADHKKIQQAMLAEQAGGTWGDARPVPGTPALDVGAGPLRNGAVTDAVSCASAGDCAAAGIYSGRADHDWPFIASEIGGTWDRAEQVPGTRHFDQPQIDAIACPAAGACVAVGHEGAANGADIFVTTQT